MITLLFASCVQDLEGIKQEKVADKDETALVTLSLSTPAPPTRSQPGSENENKVAEVDVLLFTTDNDKLYYRAPATGAAITDVNPSPYLDKTFTVRLPINPLNGSTPIPYKMVIIANARASVAGYAPNSILSPGTDRQTLLNGLASTTAGAKLAYPFPMWGEYASDLTITETSTPGTLNVDLTRAVARIDVSLDTDVANFELDSVLLYNYRDAGHVAPKYASGVPVTAACYPAGAKTPGAFLGYKLTTETADPTKKAFQEIIYAFEAANVALTNSNWMQNTCLVVGGRFNGNPNITYYRVEFVDDNDDPLDLKRNYLYNVVIDEVKADGWPTPWLAYTNKPSNIVVKITEWNDGGLNDITFNGQHYLAVDKSHVTLYRMGHREGHQKTLKAKTNYGSWTIEIPEEYDWLDVSPMTFTGGESEQIVTVRVKSDKQLVAGSGNRSGYFNIVVGNLKKKITVTQLDELEFWIAITDPTSGEPLYNLFFEAGSSLTPPASQIFRVTWFPSSITTIGVSTSLGTYPFLYAPGTEDFSDPTITDQTPDPTPDSDETRSLDFIVQPPPNTIDKERTSGVNFSVTLDGQVSTLPIFLHQAPLLTYAFSNNDETLTLFSNFPHDTDLNGMDTDNIPELADLTTAAKVKNLVIEGDIDPSHIAGIPARKTALSLSNLGSISLPDFTGTIPGGDYYTAPFRQATWLNSFETPLAVGIDTYAFYGCSKLTTVIVSNVTEVEEHAFRECKLLTTINLPSAQTIGEQAFRDCTKLTTVSAPDVRVIADWTFYGCLELNPASINYLPYVTSVGAYAFGYCRAFTSVNLPEALTLGNGAFYQCARLTHVSAPKVRRVEQQTFDQCLKLLSVDYLPHVTYVGVCAFQKCTALTTVDLSEATSIEEAAFKDCSVLASVTVPKVESIVQDAFNGCSTLTTLDLPVATSIGSAAFSNCTNLVTLKLGYSGTITLSGLLGNTQAGNIDLYLHADHMSEVSGDDNNVWKGYAWKSITQL